MKTTDPDQFLDSITVLPVTSVAESFRWYERALGFRTVYLHEGEDETEPTNYAILRRGRLPVHLILDEPPPHRRAWTRAGCGYLYLVVKDVHTIYEEVRSRGIEVARELQTEGWGARGFNLIDPSGNAIHIEEALSNEF